MTMDTSVNQSNKKFQVDPLRLGLVAFFDLFLGRDICSAPTMAR